MTQTSLATQRFVAIAVTATLSLSATVKAAEQSDSQEGVYDDNTVVITASRFKERNARLPTNITIISKDDIERSNATQVVQLLKRVAFF